MDGDSRSNISALNKWGELGSVHTHTHKPHTHRYEHTLCIRSNINVFSNNG